MSNTQKKNKPKPVKHKAIRQPDVKRTPKKNSTKIAETTPTSTFKATSEATQGKVKKKFEQILEELTIERNGELVEQLIVRYYLKGYMSENPTFPQKKHFKQPFHTNTRNQSEYHKTIKPFFEMIGSCNLINYFAKDFVESLHIIHTKCEEKGWRKTEWQKTRDKYFSEYENLNKTDTDTFMDYLVNNKQLHAFVTKPNLDCVFGNAFIFKTFKKHFEKQLVEKETVAEPETVAETETVAEPETKPEPEPETLKRKSQNEGAEISKKQKQEAEAAVQDKLAAAPAPAAAMVTLYHDDTSGKTTGQPPGELQNFVLSLQHFTSLNVKDSEKYDCPCSASLVSEEWRKEYGIELSCKPCRKKTYKTSAAMMQHINDASGLRLYHQAILQYGNLMSDGKAVTLTTSDTADKVVEASSSTAGTGGKETPIRGASDIVGGDSTSQERESTVVIGDQKTNTSVSVDKDTVHATVPETGGGGGSTDGESQKESHHSTTKSTAARVGEIVSKITEHNDSDEGHKLSSHDGSAIASKNYVLADKDESDSSSDERGNEVEIAGDRVEHEIADDQTEPDNNGDGSFDKDKENVESTATNTTVHDDSDNENKDVELTFKVHPGKIVSLRCRLMNGNIAQAYENYAISEVKETDSGPAFSYVRTNDEGKRNGVSPILRIFPPYGILHGAGKHFYEGLVENQWVKLERRNIALTDGVPLFTTTSTDRLCSTYGDEGGEYSNLIAQPEAFNEEAKASEKVATMKAEQQRTFHSNILSFGLDLPNFKTLAQKDVDTQINDNVISAGTSFAMSVNMYGQVHLVQDGNFHGYSVSRKSDHDAYQFIDAYCSSVDKKIIIETLNLSSLLNSLNLNEKGVIVGTHRFSLCFVLEGTIANMYRDGIDISVTKVTCPSQPWRDDMKKTLLHPNPLDGTHFTRNPFSSAEGFHGETILNPSAPLSFQNKCVHIPFEFMSHLPQSVILGNNTGSFTTVSQLLQSRFKANRGEVCATLLKNGLRKNPKPSKPAFALNKATISVKKFVETMPEVDKRPRSGARVVGILESRVWHYLGKMTAAAAEVLPQVWVTENYEGRKLIFPLTSLIAGTMVEINKACFGRGKDRGITGPLYRTLFNLKTKPSVEQRNTIESCTELLGGKMLEIVQSWSNVCCEFQWDAFAATAAQKQMLILTILTNKNPDIPPLLVDQGIALHLDLLVSQVPGIAKPSETK